jgi:hypothetical protein
MKFNGRPVVGFGASEEDEKKFYGTMIGMPLLGLAIGIGSGVALGISRKSVALGTVAGVVGGFAGAIGGAAVGRQILSSAT